MRRLLPVRLLMALLALGGALLLSSASEGSDALATSAKAEEGPACREPIIAPYWNIQAEPARHAARSGQPASPDLVVLNGRGYNYEPGPDARLERIHLGILDAEAALGTR